MFHWTTFLFTLWVFLCLLFAESVHSREERRLCSGRPAPAEIRSWVHAKVQHEEQSSVHSHEVGGAEEPGQGPAFLDHQRVPDTVAAVGSARSREGEEQHTGDELESGDQIVVFRADKIIIMMIMMIMMIIIKCSVGWLSNLSVACVPCVQDGKKTPADLDFWLEELYTPGFDSLLRNKQKKLCTKNVYLCVVFLCMCGIIIVVVVPIVVLKKTN